MAVIQSESVEVPVIAHKRLGSRIGPGSERSAGFTGHRNPGWFTRRRPNGPGRATVFTSATGKRTRPNSAPSDDGNTQQTRELPQPGQGSENPQLVPRSACHQTPTGVPLAAVLRAWSGQGKETRHSGRKGTAKLFAGEMLLYVGNSQKWTPSRTDKQDTESIYEAFLYLRNENQKGNRE